MNSGGINLKEFLVNLPVFHNRIMLIYPKLTPPEFKVSHIETNSIHIHYFSKRDYKSLLEDCCKDWENYMVRWLLWN
jgi:hypothetical protein